MASDEVNRFTPAASIAYHHGSEVIRGAVSYVDSISCSCGLSELINGSSSSNSSSSSSNMQTSCHCDAQVRSLRKILADLLIEEKNSMKFYFENCIAYLMQLAARVDSLRHVQLLRSYALIHILLQFFTLTRTHTQTFRVKSALCIGNKQRCMSAPLENVCINELLKTLEEEKVALQKALYSIPEIAGAIPRAFIEADPDATAASLAVGHYSIEDDGFEVL